MEIKRRRRNIAVSQKNLNRAQIRIPVQQMSRKTMTQRMHRSRFQNPGFGLSLGILESLLNMPGRKRFILDKPGEKKIIRTEKFPVSP